MSICKKVPNVVQSLNRRIPFNLYNFSKVFFYFLNRLYYTEDSSNKPSVLLSTSVYQLVGKGYISDFISTMINTKELQHCIHDFAFELYTMFLANLPFLSYLSSFFTLHQLTCFFN